MAWNYPSAYNSMYVYPVWTYIPPNGSPTMQGYLYVATDGAGNILQTQSFFRDTSNNFQRVAQISGSGDPASGGSLSFVLNNGTTFPGGTSPANSTGAGFVFTGIFSNLAQVQTNWGAGHQSGAREEAA